MTKKKDPVVKSVENKPKAALKPNSRLYIYSCRCCKAVALSDLTYLEHDLRFINQRKCLEAKEVECPICGASMDEVDYPLINIHIRSPEQMANALRLIEVAARATDILREDQAHKE